MSIVPLPQFEADLAEWEREKREFLEKEPPKTLVVRFGTMGLIGEFPYRGKQSMGCGSKLVVRTFRGIELAEMLTSTCPNAGCDKSITRKEMLEYIDRSGGKDYPFYSEGKVLRVATIDDMNQQRRLEAEKPELKRKAQELADRHNLDMTIIEAEPILGGERLTFFFRAEERIDFRDLVQDLAREHATRIDLRQVGARDEARLTADYERCGQHCCCKQFLKVLKPVSMRSAKIQKASLDPLKISGRCGRLMCCLRYEHETYEDLRKRLPKMKSRVGCPHGVGTVVDSQILTQLVKIRLEHDQSFVAVAVEDLCPPEEAPDAMRRGPDPMRGADARKMGKRRGRGKPTAEQRLKAEPNTEAREQQPETGDGKKKRRRRRRKRKPGDDAQSRPDASRETGDNASSPAGDGGPSPAGDAPAQDGSSTGDAPKKKRRRRRRRRKPGGGGGDQGGGSGDGGGGGSGGGGEG